MPAHLPPAEGETPREHPGGRAQTQLLLQPSATPGLGHLLPSAAKPSVSGVARRWHLPGEVGNASWICSSSLAPALLFVGGKNQSLKKSEKALGISAKMLGSYLENHHGLTCSVDWKHPETPRVWRPGDALWHNAYSLGTAPEETNMIKSLLLPRCAPSETEQGRRQREVSQNHVCGKTFKEGLDESPSVG